MTADAAHHHPAPRSGRELTTLAVSATLHCLTGCAIGEVLGMVIGTALGFSDWGTVALAVALAFLFGYSLTILPLLRAGLALGAVIPIALAADTLSIAVMEIVDNAVMLAIPGAMHEGVDSLLFWGALAFALAVAGVVAVPVNRWLIARGKGHARVHETGIHGGPPVKLVGAVTVVMFVFGSAVLAGELLSEDEPAHGGGHAAQPATGKRAERAFLAAMTDHHESAIRTGRMARERGRSRFVRGLGRDIVRTQAAEVRQMASLHRRLIGRPLVPDPRGHDALGLDAEEAGMAHGRDDERALATARPFDRAFVDHMIGHHEGAVRMAAVIRKRSGDRELGRLADRIVRAQQREIAQMRRFRQRTYGSAGPPPVGEGHGGHDHGGHD